MRLLLPAVIGLALSVAACGGGDNGATPSPSPSATASPSPTVSPTPSPSPLPTPVPLATLPPSDSSASLIFTRGSTQDNSSPSAVTDIGEIWASDIGGNDAQRLTPEGSRARFVGLAGDPLTGSGYVYYIADMTSDSATIYRLHFPGGAQERVLSFHPWTEGWAFAALSPSGSRIAFSDAYGLELLDLATYRVDRVVSGGDPGRCGTPGGGIGACTAFQELRWSPDGSLIAASEIFWESGQTIVVAPGGEPFVAGNGWGDAWSPGSDAVCSWGQFAAPSALYVARAPDWTKQPYLAEFEVPVSGNPSQSVSGCFWLDAQTVAVQIANWAIYPDANSTYVGLISTADGSLKRLTPDEKPLCCSSGIVGGPGLPCVFRNYILPTTHTGTNVPGQPQAIDPASGDIYGVLQTGDWIVAVVTP
jgi:hypothetical protein